MKIALDRMDKAELQEVSRAIDARMKALEEERWHLALREMQAVAEKHGVLFKELVRGSGGSKRTVSVPKYRHPENPALTWSGRGRRPAWVAAALEDGKSLKELAIEAP